MAYPFDCHELQQRLRDYEDEVHRLQDEMREANNALIQLERELRKERARLRTLEAADTAAGGVPAGRTALAIAHTLGVLTLREAIRRQRAVVEKKERELRLVIRTQEQGRPKAGELQDNIDRTITDMRNNGC